MLDEPVLDDDYPTYWRYFYVLDGVPTRSRVTGTVADLKRKTGASEVRRCDAVARKLPAGFHVSLSAPRPTLRRRLIDYWYR